MPLPFLTKKSVPGIIVKQRKPDEVAEAPDNAAMEACAQDILRAISMNDSKHLALAIQAAIECAMDAPESQPEDNSFAGRNIAAASQESE